MMTAALVAVIFSFGCHRSNTPVDEYVAILEQAAEKVEQISSFGELMDVNEIISPDEALEVIHNNPDYPLTDKDKERLKQSYDRLLRASYEKTLEYGDFPESIKKQTRKQMELYIETANSGIDRAKTLGEL